MVDIVALLQCTRPHVTATTVRQLSRIIVAMVAMTGRVTMVGIARWAGTRRQLSHHPALFRHGHPVGHTLLGLLPAPSVLSG